MRQSKEIFRQIWDLPSRPVQLNHGTLLGGKPEKWNHIVWNKQKVQVMYFSCSSLLREKRKSHHRKWNSGCFEFMNKTLRKYLWTMYDCLLVYTCLSKQVDLFLRLLLYKRYRNHSIWWKGYNWKTTNSIICPWTTGLVFLSIINSQVLLLFPIKATC